MPIEIRELVIKASVQGGDQSSTQPQSDSRPSSEAQSDIVAACVAQILAILKDERER